MPRKSIAGICGLSAFHNEGGREMKVNRSPRIFKVQKSLESSGQSKMLIYDAHMEYIGEVPIGRKTGMAWPFGASAKVYVEGYVDESGELMVNKLVEEQEW
jgi:hypothetical protein